MPVVNSAVKVASNKSRLSILIERLFTLHNSRKVNNYLRTGTITCVTSCRAVNK